MTQKTYAEMVAEINRLQEVAEDLRKKEVVDVIQTIKQQIKDYNLTAKDIGIAIPRNRNAPEPLSIDSKKRGQKGNAKFRHPETGVTWSGRGRMPKWITEAVEQGRTKEEFAV